MKHCRIIEMIVVLSMLFAFGGCVENTKKNETGKEYTLVQGAVSVNGEVAPEVPAFIGSSNLEDVRLPFMQIARSLGMTVEPKADGLFHIMNGDDVYILNSSSEITLVKQGDASADNLLLPPPGSSSYYCRYEMDDVFVDSDTLSGAFYRMGITIHMSFDYDVPKIEIVKAPI